MSEFLKKQLENFVNAKNCLTVAILEELGAKAKELGVVRMEFGLVNYYYLEGDDFKDSGTNDSKIIDPIEAIEALYLDNIHQCGFDNIWTKENGWIG